MDSSSNDRDKGSNNPPSKPENPFVKFKQFADSQISSLLQGVLGIPSAFSRPNGNPRWDVFDEDLRRRDELIAKQQAIKDSELQRQNAQSEERKILVKTSSDWGYPSNIVKNQSEPYTRLGHGLIDMPLYGPVEKSFGTHDSGKFSWLSSSIEQPPYYLEPAQVSNDVMGMVRSMVYNNLSQSSRLYSSESLLPYLLQSPYSPLKLHSEQMKAVTPETYINYNAAFADLLAATYGKATLANFKPKPIPSIESFPLMSAAAQMQKIDILAELGVLENPASKNSLVKTVEENTKDTQTEQDMYESFLRMSEHPTSTSSTFESLFKEVEKTVEKEIGPQEAAYLREQKAAFVKEHEVNLRELEGMLSGLMVPSKEALKEETSQKEDSNRVVATRTTTEHSTNQDGTVETSVTVERTFEDGRTTVTHTSHVEDSTSRDASKEMGSEKGQSDEKQTSKNGWFWK